MESVLKARDFMYLLFFNRFFDEHFMSEYIKC